MNKKNVLIFGAGSIGNHMTYASINLGYKVFITDKSQTALNRMKKLIYKKRYGNWNKEITQVSYKDVFKNKFFFDLIIIGTPPDTHLDLAENIIKNLKFKNILIEKPLFPFNQKKINLSNKKINGNIFCGYNHSLSNSFLEFIKILSNKKFRNINFIDIQWREGWEGILGAHFWMKNEYDSYLGNYLQGGGASQEHSHSIHLGYILKKLFLKKDCKYKNGQTYFQKSGKKKYDKFSQLFFANKTQSMNISIDLFSPVAKKEILVCSDRFKVKLEINFKKNQDAITTYSNGKQKIKIFKKTRSMEFENELNHIKKVTNTSHYKNSSINLSNAVETMEIIKKHFTYCDKK